MNKIKVVFFALFSLLFIVGIWLNDVFVLISITATFFALCSYLLTNESINKREKNRPTAMFYSFVPGAAHIYLRQYKRSVSFLAMYGVIGILFLLMFHIDGSGSILVLTFIGLLFCVAFLSMVDTEYVCNALNLPYTGDVYEVRIKNYFYSYLVCIFPLFIPLLASTYYVFSEETKNNDMYIVTTIILLMIILIWIIGCVISKKKIHNNPLEK